MIGKGQQSNPHVTTASTQVRDTYYDSPVIKAPHWRWLIIVYFFLGGLAGASSAIATLADLFSKDKGLARAARYLSFVALAPTPLLLILDLGRPERFLNMLRVVKLRSPMSLGSWALTGFGLFSSIAVGVQFLGDISGREVMPSVKRSASFLALPFGLFVAGYTGLLLAITNIPLWAKNYLLMGPLFLSSAFSTSLAALSLILGWREPETAQPAYIGDRRGHSRGVARAEAICLTAELALVTASVVRLGKLGAPLTRGKWGLLFWPVTYVGGILVPLVLQLSGPVRGKAVSPTRRTITSLLTLIGGFNLRVVMIFAGRESANRPADYFELTGGSREF